MFTAINSTDYTAYADTLDIEVALGDPHPQLTFQVEDVGSQFTITDGMEVVVWDEGALPSNAQETVPSNNMLVDPNFAAASGGSDANYATDGVYPGNVSFGSLKATFTFSNQDGDSVALQTTQDSYYTYIVPGQQYMFSAYVKGNSPVNINYYVQINWMDAAGQFMSNVFSGFTSPPTTQTRVNCSGTAPFGATFIQVQFGGYTTVAGTNSGTIEFQSLQLEPMLFVGSSLVDMTPITYPTPDLNNYQANCVLMPDGTFSRKCRLYTGYISYHERYYVGNDRYYTITCKPVGDLIENGSTTGQPVNVSYVNQTDAFIINDVVSTYFTGLLSTGQMNTLAPSTTVFAGWLVDAASYADRTFREVLNSLSDLSAFSFFVDPYGYIHYNDTPFDYAPFQVSRDTVPDNLAIFAPQQYKFISDSTQLRNTVKVTGGQFSTEYQETFSGNGANTNFNLSFVPTKITSITVTGSLLAPTSANHIGVAGQDINGQSGVVALMDAANPVGSGGPRVVLLTAPPNAANNVVITYSTQKNVSILSRLPSSIAQYRRNFTAKVHDSNLVSNASAGVRGNSEIASFAVPQLTMQWVLNVFVYPGTTVFFTSAADNLTMFPFVVQKVKATSLGNGLYRYEYEVGSYRPTIHDRLRNAHKAIARNTSRANSTPILVNHILTEDIITSNDNAFATIGVPTTAKYGSAIYGFSVFN